MKIEINLSIKYLNLKKDFVSNKGVTNGVSQLYVTVNEDNEIGYGVSGLIDNNIDQAILSELEVFLNKSVTNENPFHLIENMKFFRMKSKSIQLSLEMACLDWIGKKQKKRVSQMFYSEVWRDIYYTSLSISSLPLNELIQEVLNFAHWPILKFKVSSMEEIYRLQEVRNHYNGKIWVDGNGALELQEAIEAAKFLSTVGVELLEQPLSPNNLKDFQTLYQHSPIKLVADEDCKTIEDIDKVKRCSNVVNIKLSKCASMFEAYEMIKKAKEQDLEVMLGCKTESVIGVNAIAQFIPLADYCDLDGAVDIENDLFRGLEIHQGKICLNQLPGLGVIPSNNKGGF